MTEAIEMFSLFSAVAGWSVTDVPMWLPGETEDEDAFLVPSDRRMRLGATSGYTLLGHVSGPSIKIRKIERSPDVVYNQVILDHVFDDGWTEFLTPTKEDAIQFIQQRADAIKLILGSEAPQVNCRDCVYWVSERCHLSAPTLLEDGSSWGRRPRTSGADFCGSGRSRRGGGGV